MKKIVLTFASVVALSLSLMSCSKKDDPKPSNTTTTPTTSTDTKTLLTTGSWIEVKSTIKKKNSDVDSVSTTPEPCDADDLITYKSDGTYVSDAGATKCDPTDPQTESGGYTLSADGKTITDNEFPIPQTILEISSTKLVIKFSFFDTYVVEYKKK
jgi:hypothetical protein